LRQIWVRPAEKKDLLNIRDWMLPIAQLNLFDPDIVNYPQTQWLCAYDESGPLLYMPYQPVISMESLAPRPGLSAREEAMALREITKTVAYKAKECRIEEIVFACKDERVIDFAQAHGFEVLPWKVLRLKLKNLEEPKQDAVEK
jgi:hypothetical protein